ncbi:MAG TPA: hypothetical protein PK498_03560 [Candidatus Kapabacteria bacterium]|nr:hypothetical protein [Candidatus Kapabacteria bacterium]
MSHRSSHTRSVPVYRDSQAPQAQACRQRVSAPIQREMRSIHEHL